MEMSHRIEAVSYNSLRGLLVAQLSIYCSSVQEWELPEPRDAPDLEAPSEHEAMG